MYTFNGIVLPDKGDTSLMQRRKLEGMNDRRLACRRGGKAADFRRGTERSIDRSIDRRNLVVGDYAMDAIDSIMIGYA